ncbi:MAG: hypothetical protein KAG56_11045, partial [Sulfurovaceae bacterium]|nr:hypothetical protein [Sulfurovaceae bacterium]
PTTPTTPTDIPLMESDFESLYNGVGDTSYNSKAELKFVKLDNGKTLYMANTGAGDMSVPSCLNGKSIAYDCSPTGWTMGMKSNEIYAIRFITKENYTSAKIRSKLNQLSDGLTRSANYNFNIAKKPGDMKTKDFAGRCKLSTENSGYGAIYLTPPGSHLAGKAYVCLVKPNETLYLNVELRQNSYATCDKEDIICSGHFMQNGFKLPDNRH